VDGSGTDEDRKIKRVNSTGNDLGLYVLSHLTCQERADVRYNYNQYNQNPTDLSTFAQQASNGMPQVPDIPAGDFTWDQSQVGSYDPSAAATFMSLMNGGNTTTSTAASTPVGEDVGPSSDILGGMMGEKKWAGGGGAPMFNTPNCMSPLPSSSTLSLSTYLPYAWYSC
jgi:hypothetical protein